MGRPLDKALFGEPTGDFNKLTIKFWNGSSVSTGWIVEQVATGEYIVNDGMVSDRVELQASLPTATGQGAIEVLVFGGGTEYARNITAHRVKTFEGGNYSWSFESASEAGQADISLA